MDGLYAESSVKKRATASVYALKSLAILGVFVLLMATIFLGNLVGILLALYVVFLIWYWPRFKIEWEYIFVDGQLDFDMIMGGEKRKNILRVELEDADVVAPIDSTRLDGYRHLKERDFTSLNPDAKVYAIAVKIKEEKMVLLFEPNTGMIEKMKIKAPDKVEV